MSSLSEVEQREGEERRVRDRTEQDNIVSIINISYKIMEYMMCHQEKKGGSQISRKSDTS